MVADTIRVAGKSSEFEIREKDFHTRPQRSAVAKAVSVAIIAGMIALGATIAMMITMFQEAKSDRAIERRSDMIRMFGSWAFFYLATYLLTTRLLARNAIESQT